MKTISRPITRETAILDRSRPIVITIYPRFMKLHLKGTRESYTLGFDAAFSLAAKQSMDMNGGKK